MAIRTRHSSANARWTLVSSVTTLRCHIICPAYLATSYRSHALCSIVLMLAGDYGLGFCANSLELGCDCVGTIHYFDGLLSNATGGLDAP